MSPASTKLRQEDGAPSAALAAQDNRAAVSVAVAARLLGKSSDTIYRWLNEGTLAGRKVGGRWLVYRDSIESRWSAGLVEVR